MQNLVDRPDRGKPFPLAIESEKAILGIILLFPDRMSVAWDQDLDSEDFLDAPHRAIFYAMQALHSDRTEITVQSVYARMSALGTAHQLTAREREAYLVGVQTECGSPCGLLDHINTVKRAAIDRQLTRARAELDVGDLASDQKQELASRLEKLTTARDQLLLGAEGWPGDPDLPIPLDDISAPPWPRGVLPPPFDAYVNAVAESIQVPLDLPGILALSVMSTCFAGKVRAIPYAGYAEPLSIYAIGAADVGERKSSTYRAMVGPIFNYEAERRERLAPKQTEFETKKAIMDADLQSALHDRKRHKPGTPDHQNAAARIGDIRAELAALQPPPRAEFLTTDPTPEGLSRLMSETGGNACLMDSEGGGFFDLLAGLRYGDNPSIDPFLKSYDDERLVVHRSQRERQHPPIEHPALTIGLLTQPSTLRTLSERKELSERGMVQRMIFAIPAVSMVGHRVAIKPPIPSATAESYSDIVLRGLRAEKPAVPHEVVFSPEALSEYKAFYERIEPSLLEGGELYEMRGWAGKLPGRIVRIATLFHLMTCPAPEPWTVAVSGDSFRRAVALSAYLIGHTRRAFGMMLRAPETASARRILDWIGRERLQSFTTSDAHRKVMKNVDVSQVRKALTKLHRPHNFIAPAKASRRDQERWMVHPAQVRGWKNAESKPSA